MSSCDEDSDYMREIDYQEDNEDSDEYDDNNEYIPSPYIFTLKDIFNKPISLQPQLSENCKIACPSFHILLDHTIAVLWTIFSERNTQIIQTSHIHWALKFLEGVKDKHNQQTDDVKIAISHLQDILINMISNLDIYELEKRNEQSYKLTNYNDFNNGLKNKNDNNNSSSLLINKSQSRKIDDCGACDRNTSADADDSEAFVTALTINDENPPPQSLTDKVYTELHENKEYPSFILEDMLGKTDPDKLEDIINITKNNFHRSSKGIEKLLKLNNTHSRNNILNDCDAVGGDKTNQINITKEILNWRECQYNKIIHQLQQMSQLDEAFKTLNCSSSSEIIKKFEKFINQPECGSR